MKPSGEVIAMLIASALVIAVPGCDKREEAPRAQAENVLYHCPMHPTYTSDKPGDCPICNMSLVRVATAAPAPAHGAQPAAPSAADPDSHAQVAGYVPVTLSPELQQRIGVKLARAVRGPAEKTIRAAGRVEYDERHLHHVHTRTEGWIGELYVATTGQMVRKGDPLFTLYSPELVSAQEEFILALGQPGEPPSPLLNEVRRRLKLLQVSDATIRQLEVLRRPQTHVDIVAHASGVVVEKNAIEGMRAMPGEDLYLLADLSRVWVTASLYEHELAFVRMGQRARVTIASYPGETFRGRITYIYPYLDVTTRTNSVRFEFENPGLKLKPGMFGNVELTVPLGQAITVPRNAVLDSGERQIVFIATSGGRFEPREVTLGPELGDDVAIRRGVKEGEEVVVGAHFLIDSESQLKAAIEGMKAAGEQRH